MRARIRYRTSDGRPASPEHTATGDGGYWFQDDDTTRAVHELTGWALGGGTDLETLEVTLPSLEDVYLELTAGSEREETA